MITLFLRLLFRLVMNLKHKLFNFLLHNLSLKPLNKIQNIIDNKNTTNNEFFCGLMKISVSFGTVSFASHQKLWGDYHWSAFIQNY